MTYDELIKKAKELIFDSVIKYGFSRIDETLVLITNLYDCYFKNKK